MSFDDALRTLAASDVSKARTALFGNAETDPVEWANETLRFESKYMLQAFDRFGAILPLRENAWELMVNKRTYVDGIPHEGVHDTEFLKEVYMSAGADFFRPAPLGFVYSFECNRNVKVQAFLCACAVLGSSDPPLADRMARTLPMHLQWEDELQSAFDQLVSIGGPF